MAGASRTRYTTEDRAEALARLHVCDGNIRRACREMQAKTYPNARLNKITPSSLREWRDEHERNPNPLVDEFIANASQWFVAEAESIVQLATAVVRRGLEHTLAKDEVTIKDAQAATMVGGTWYDKQRTAAGLPNSRTEVEQIGTTISATEVAAAIQNMGASLLHAAAATRADVDILEAELVEEAEAEAFTHRPQRELEAPQE